MAEQNSAWSGHLHRCLSTKMRLVVMSVLWFIGGCGGEDRGADENLDVNIEFAVTAGGLPFQCGRVVDNLGKEGASLAITDMRFYIHDVRLINGQGEAQPVTLVDDGVWQKDGVALLDFEDGCANGTRQLNSRVQGQSVDGSYTGIQFRIGIPNQLNSPRTVLENRGSPLNQASLFWSWRSGYKFMRVDTDSDSFRFHLGSVGCDDDFNCRFENIPTITISGFEWQTQVVHLDIDYLLEETNVGENTDGTAPGCMGDQDDPECRGIFARLGLGTAETTAFSGRAK